MSLLDVLDRAELCVVDDDLRIVFVWFGGFGVNVYDETGREIDYFTMESGENKPKPHQVRKAIERMIEYNRQEHDDE